MRAAPRPRLVGMAVPEIPTHAEAEERMRELIASGGLAEPDEVRYEFDPDEVVFVWHRRRLAVIVELEEGGDDAAGMIPPPVAPPV